MISQNPHQSSLLGYLPALDGLRSIAILPVMAAHAGINQVAGGNFGVDVFFVLSGFLITAKLLEEWRRDGRIELKSFYWRRGVRLLPALFLLLAAWVVYALCFDPEAGILFSLYTLFYAANWVRAFGIDDSMALGHTWSLSIEEQFYLVWPLLLIWLLSTGRTRRFVFRLLVVGVVVVALWRAYLWQQGADIDRLYNGTDTRADALLVGCALAFAVGSGFMKRWGHLFAVPCLLVVTYVMVFDLPSRTFWLRDGGATMVAVIIAFLIWSLVGSERRGWVHRLVECAPLVWIGKISYGLYLWHLPVYYVVGWERPWSPYTTLAVKFAVAFALATLSYYLVEQPIQRWAKRRGVARAPALAEASPQRLGGVTS